MPKISYSGWVEEHTYAVGGGERQITTKAIPGGSVDVKDFKDVVGKITQELEDYRKNCIDKNGKPYNDTLVTVSKIVPDIIKQLTFGAFSGGDGLIKLFKFIKCLDESLATENNLHPLLVGTNLVQGDSNSKEEKKEIEPKDLVAPLKQAIENLNKIIPASSDNIGALDAINANIFIKFVKAVRDNLKATGQFNSVLQKCVAKFFESSAFGDGKNPSDISRDAIQIVEHPLQPVVTSNTTEMSATSDKFSTTLFKYS